LDWVNGSYDEDEDSDYECDYGIYCNLEGFCCFNNDNGEEECIDFVEDMGYECADGLCCYGFGDSDFEICFDVSNGCWDIVYGEY
jgi:hypothetical protein